MSSTNTAELSVAPSRRTNFFSFELMKVPKSGLPVERRKALHLRRFATATSRRSYRPLAPLFLVLLPRQIPLASHFSTTHPPHPPSPLLAPTTPTPTTTPPPPSLVPV